MEKTLMLLTRKSIISAISIKVMEPVLNLKPKPSWVLQKWEKKCPRFVLTSMIFGTQLDNFLHKHTETAEAIRSKILQAEKERKELCIRKLAKERAKKASLHNKKLRDCRIHLGDLKKDRRLESTIFITEEIQPVDQSLSQGMSILKQCLV